MKYRKVNLWEKNEFIDMLKRPIFTLIALVLVLPAWGQQAQRFEPGINTVYEEREPIPSPDGKTLYFWRREAPENAGGVMDPGDIWYTTRNSNGSWSQARRFGPPLNSNGHDFVWQVSKYHDTLWINQVPPGVKDDGLAYSVKDRNGYWGVPKDANIRNFRYKGNYKDYFFSSGRIMFLPNEGENSYGGTDIYLCFPINDTAWAAPINLGPDINTAGDEDAPYLAPDGKTLYFTSNGHDGQGRLDIFVSERLDNSWRNWSKPRNIGAPVNTKGDDFDFMLSSDGKTLFWCSDTKSIGSNDMLYLDLADCRVDIYPQGEHTLCQGEKLTLEAGFAMGENIRYQWLRDGRRITGAVDRSLTVTESGLYQVVRMRTGCLDTSAVSNVRFVTPPDARLQTPSAVICLDDSVRLTTVSSSRYTYRWRKNGLLIPKANRSFYWVNSPGKYMVEIFEGGCKAASEELRLTSFREPGIYTAKDTQDGLLPILPRWLWTNKLAKPKGDSYLRDITSGANGSVFVLNSVEKRGGYYDQVTGFFPEGLYRMSLPEISRSDLSERFVATDQEGNIILASNDVYLEKYRADGVLMWKKDEKRQKISGLATDPLGNIYTMGRFQDTLILGTKVIAAANRGGLFVAKHSARGELIWLETFPVDWYKYDFGNSLHVDCEGNVYIAGGFSSIANFRKNILRASLQGESYFVARFSTDGNLDWSFRIVTEKTRTRTHDIHTDCEGNTFVTFNREIWRIDKRGVVLWHGQLKTPDGASTVQTRIAGIDGDLYINGITDRNELFMTKLNRMNRQVIIWRRKGSGDPETTNPVIATNHDG
ncbi:MAG: PD40 domain-containing protein, partial [Bacteroidetes bacterium]|nr:PD40 domain-containing protein [Bacteroidota bacterium]